MDTLTPPPGRTRLVGNGSLRGFARAELSNKYKIPLADNVIAATALGAGCPLVSDDEHFNRIKSLKTRWPTPPNLDSKRL
jgi:predicted nucleic acid-binding protein